MPADRDLCSRLLRQFPKLPFTPEGFSALVDALSERAIDDRHALDTVTAILEAWTSDMACPTVADLRRVLYERRPETHDKPCPDCAGVGWLSRSVVRDGVVYAAAKPCKCRASAPVETPQPKAVGKLARADFKALAGGGE